MFKVLYGTERYLIDNELSRIAHGERFDGFSDMVFDAISSYPIFADRNQIIVSCEKLPSDKRFLDLVGKLPKFTDLIVVPQTMDKRSKEYKALDKAGVIEIYDKVERERLSGLLLGLISKGGSRIRTSTMNYLVDRSGYLMDDDVDLYQMRIWVKQLCFASEDEITIEMVDAVIPSSSHVKAFALAGLLLENDGDGVFALAKQLLEEKEEPIKILSLILRTFRLGYKRSLYPELSDADAAKKIGVPAFQLHQVKKVKPESLNRCMEIILESVSGIKTGAKSRVVFFLALSEMLQELGGNAYA